MSMPDEQPAPDGQPQGPLTRRIFGLPVIVWVIIVAIVAFIWFSRRGGGLFGGGKGSNITTSGGGGSATSGRTQIDKGAVTITVTQGDREQPGPPVRKRKAKMATVPNVIGRNWPQAADAIRHADLNPERTRNYTGETTKEKPAAGKKVKRGSRVELEGNDTR